MTSDGPPPVALVTQTRVLPDRGDDFATWLHRLETAAEGFAGYLDQTSIEPAPPFQPEWVVVQRFEAVGAARAWLESVVRRRLLDEVGSSLVGHIDVHLFTEGTERPSSAVSAVISTRVAPGKEEEFLRWHRRIVAAQASFLGYEGYRLERPIPGVQDDWVAILRFDSQEHLDVWMDSDQRRTLLREGGAFADKVDIHMVRSGFDAWVTFDETGSGAGSAPVWKMNMLVLLALYPVVFLFGEWVHTPLLIENDVPFWLALFVGNVVSVALLGWVLVPWVSRRFRWWLAPPAPGTGKRNWIGATLVASIYALFLVVFSQI